MTDICQVVSPFQAIVNYEKENNIPHGWINFAISRSSPNGYWQRLERDELKLNDDWFKGFGEDLTNPDAWNEFQNRSQTGKKRLKDLANPTQLGDPVSLKAESANSKPTNQDRGLGSSGNNRSGSIPVDSSGSKDTSKKSLKELAQNNPTLLGDPVSLKAESADSEPTDQDRGASSSSDQPPLPTHTRANDPKPAKKLKDLATQNPSQLGDPVSLKAETADSSPTSADRGASQPQHSSTPPLPKINPSKLFWSMMSISRSPDPHIYPYLSQLASLSPRPFILGALSNTITFPPSHPFNAPYNSKSQLRSLFDIFVSSSEVGMRKPHREIYELALKELDRVDRERGGTGVKPEEVLFLDDIGENLRMGKSVGMRTLKVELGRTEVAVRELERLTGVKMDRGRKYEAKL